MGKKFGFGWSLALPVMRQNEDILIGQCFSVWIVFYVSASLYKHFYSH